jgi:flagellar L-ring protein FlgH
MMNMNKKTNFLILGLFSTLVVLLFSSCSNNVRMKDKTDSITDIMKFDPEDENVSTSPGSLYSEETVNGMLFLDHKARRRNDIVTVKIVEASKASDKASTKTSKKSSISAGVSNLFGFETPESVGKMAPDFRTPSPSTLITGSMDNSYDGAGSTSREGTLLATITCVVTKVLPNGNLVIQGSRDITINSEKQIIGVQGIIRPKDISPDNTVLSTAIAQAEIKYVGSGALSEKQREGWGSRVINWVWPF